MTDYREKIIEMLESINEGWILVQIYRFIKNMTA